jgi:hypothetical protein
MLSRLRRLPLLARLGLFVLALFALPALAGTLVDQGSGTTTTRPWRVTLTDATGTAADLSGAAYLATGAPAARVSVSAVSAAATGLTAGARYRVACDTTVYFRTGSGTPTAVTTDAPIYGPSVEYLALRTGDTGVAFITGAGTGTCVLSRLYSAP